MSIVVFCLMFLAIYAPKVSGRIDLLSLTFVALIFLSIITGSYNSLSRRAVLMVSVCCLYLVFLLLHTVILVYFNSWSDIYQPLRFSRSILNVLGIAALISFYFSIFKDRATDKIIYHVWLCVITHGLIICAMFFFHSFNVLVVDYVVNMDSASDNYDARIKGNRISGLTSSWDATSAIQSLGVLLLPIIVKKTRGLKRFFIVLIAFFVTILSMALSGLTGFLVVLLFGVFLTYYSSGFMGLFKLFVGGAVFLPIVLVGFLFAANNYSEKVSGSSIARVIYMVAPNSDVNYSSSGRAPTALETIELIAKKMYFLPDDKFELLFGLGSSGRFPDDYYISSDTGPTLNIHNLGLIYSAILYAFVVNCMISVFRGDKKDIKIPFFVFTIISLVVFIDLKVQYLLSRNSLSFMMIALILYWQNLPMFRRTLNKSPKSSTMGSSPTP